MRGYFIRRLLALIPTLIFATLIVFFLIRLVPGNVIDMMISMHDISDEEVTRASLERALGLDVSVHVQYYRWMKAIILHCDLGTSLCMGTSVTEEVMARLPVTLELGIIALIIGVVLAIPIGVYSAIRQDTAGDYGGRTVAILGLAVPSFWLGTMIVVYPALWWDWSPSIDLVSFREDPIENLKTFIVPGAVMGLAFSAVQMRMTRAMMLEVLRQDYIRTAWAKGLKEKTVIIRHALKNALIPVITLIGLYVPVLVAGSIIMESIFVLPGLGLLLIESINQRDYPIVMGLMLIFGVVILVINLVVDLSYGFLDPKVRYK
ncbi:MAG: ABC transporter permease [Deltaproteobacteria bacterium]|nr:ABC transporter permease [Deltaproteobacteria bacterium]